jgi:hypothetical protein
VRRGRPGGGARGWVPAGGQKGELRAEQLPSSVGCPLRDRLRPGDNKGASRIGCCMLPARLPPHASFPLLLPRPGEWFCSEECQRIRANVNAAVQAQQMDIPGHPGHTWQVMRGKDGRTATSWSLRTAQEILQVGGCGWRCVCDGAAGGAPPLIRQSGCVFVVEGRGALPKTGGACSASAGRCAGGAFARAACVVQLRFLRARGQGAWHPAALCANCAPVWLPLLQSWLPQLAPHSTLAPCPALPPAPCTHAPAHHCHPPSCVRTGVV